MYRDEYYKRMGWGKSPFIKSTSLDIPIIGRVREYDIVCEAIGGWDRIMTVTAPIGYGKTTFMNQLIMQKPRGIKYVMAINSYESPGEVIKRIKNTLPFYKRFFNTDKSGFPELLQKRLGVDRMLLLFDEAQDYDTELFKWLRVVNDRAENVFMIFFGLAGLEDKITAETSFRDRKSKSIRLEPFVAEDLEEIVRERIKWVGGKTIKPFTVDGLKRLCESCNRVPRLLLEHGQKVIEDCAKNEVFSADSEYVERALGKVSHMGGMPDSSETVYEPQEEPRTIKAKILKESGDYDFMADLSPTQQDIVMLLLEHESLSISELAEYLKKDIRSLGSLIRKLRGLNKSEVERKPNVPYPVIIRKGKENRMGRLQYVFALSDNSRRKLAKK
jgi:hypothetical protein